MLYLVLFTAGWMAWALLRIMGDERQRRVQTLEAAIEAEMKALAEAREAAKKKRQQ